jgi:hypothetical protein
MKNILISVIEQALYLCNESAYLCQRDMKAKYAEIMDCPDTNRSLDSVLCGFKTWDALHIEDMELSALLADFNNLQKLFKQYQAASTVLVKMLEGAKKFDDEKIDAQKIDQLARELLECAMNFKGE